MCMSCLASCAATREAPRTKGNSGCSLEDVLAWLSCSMEGPAEELGVVAFFVGRLELGSTTFSVKRCGTVNLGVAL